MQVSTVTVTFFLTVKKKAAILTVRNFIELKPILKNYVLLTEMY